MPRATPKKKVDEELQFRYLKETLQLTREGSGKARRHVVVKTTKDGEPVVLWEGTPGEYEKGIHEFRRLAREMSEKDTKAREARGNVKVVKKAVKKSVKAVSKKERKATSVKTPQTEALIDTLTAYGYAVVPSPKMKEGGGGCYRAMHRGINRANILSSSTGVRVAFLPRASFIMPGTTTPVIEIQAAKPDQKVWRFCPKREENGDYEYVMYSGPTSPELLQAFGIDPNGPGPKEPVLESRITNAPTKRETAAIPSRNHDKALVRVGRKGPVLGIKK